MKKNNIKIGTFCHDMHIQPSKLRYYESLGLIQPETVDEENGYHYYSYAQYAEIEIIQICRKLNFPLKNISHFQETKDSCELLRIIAKQKSSARKLLLQQQEIYQNLSWLYETLADAIALQEGKPQEIVCQKRPARKVLMARPETEKNLSLEETDAALQYQLSKTVSSEHYAVNSIQRIYGFHIKRKQFLQGKLNLQGKFVELPQYLQEIEATLETIPAGMYLTLPVQAFSDTSWIARICDYAEEYHLKILEVYLTEITLHLIPSNDAFYEAQVLVEADL